MSDPKTDREASPTRPLLLDVAAVIILVIAAGGYALYQRIGVLDGKVRTPQASMSDLKARVERVKVLIGCATTGIIAPLCQPAKVEQTLDRIEVAAHQNRCPRPVPSSY